MNTSRTRLLTRLLTRSLTLAAVLLPLHAGAYTRVVVFGDSLSDSGNNAAVLGTRSQVITGNGYVPTYPYPSGTYSNGNVWATSFAAGLGLTALPSLAGGTDYAYGGAETGGRTRFPPSLQKQLDTYLGSSPTAVGDTLFVVAGGGNNARAAADKIAGGANAKRTASSAAKTYASDIGGMVDRLQAAGASSIVVWDTPDIGTTPQARAAGTSAIGSSVAGQMNVALNKRLLGEAGVSVFDVYGLVDTVALHPGAYGLVNTTDACGAVIGCNPSTYLFWDGIHPTSAGHAILADAMLDRYGNSPTLGAFALQPVPEPATAALFGAGAGVLLVLRQASARSRRSTSAASL